MRTFSVLVWATTLLASANAWPHGWCLCRDEAEVIGNDFALLISDYNATFANLVLADDYTDQSDSVNTLIDSGTTAPIPVCELPITCHDALSRSLLQR